MAELVDALASGASGGNPVEVQVLSSVPILHQYQRFSQFFLVCAHFCAHFSEKPRVFVELKATNRSGVAGIHRGFTTSANFIEGDYVDYTQRQNNESKVINRT